MPETLLTPSSIKLYGRLLTDIELSKAAAPGDNSGDNHFLRRQLRSGEPSLARIYGYAYEGTYYELPKPAIFLVHGDGAKASPAQPIAKGREEDDKKTEVPSFQATGATRTERSGVAIKDWEFSWDIRVWEYDKGDFSLRMEVISGTLEEILLEAEVEAAMITQTGRVQVSGAGRVQVAGSGRVQVSHAGRMQVAHRGGKLE